jgi:septal ring factor EnvC (AmiA/AmiB activator)
VIAVDEFADGMAIVLDHGNGWQSSLRGLTGLLVAVGDDVRRSAPLGAVAEGLAAGQGRVRLGVTLDGRLLDAGRYLLRA